MTEPTIQVTDKDVPMQPDSDAAIDALKAQRNEALDRAALNFGLFVAAMKDGKTKDARITDLEAQLAKKKK